MDASFRERRNNVRSELLTNNKEIPAENDIPVIGPSLLDPDQVCSLWEAQDFDTLSSFFAKQVRFDHISIIGSEDSVRQMVSVTITCIRERPIASIGSDALGFSRRLIKRDILTDMLINDGLIAACMTCIAHAHGIRDAALTLCEIVREETYSRAVATEINPVDLIYICCANIAEEDIQALIELIEALFVHEPEVYSPDVVVSCVHDLIKMDLTAEYERRVLNAIFYVCDNADVAALVIENQAIIAYVHEQLSKSLESQQKALDVLARLLYHSDVVFPVNIRRIVELADTGGNENIVLSALNVIENCCTVPEVIDAVVSVGGFTVLADKMRAGTFSTKDFAAAAIANMVLRSNPEIFPKLMEEDVVRVLLECVTLDGDNRVDALKALVELCHKADQTGNWDRFREVLEAEGARDAIEEVAEGADEEVEALVKTIQDICMYAA